MNTFFEGKSYHRHCSNIFSLILYSLLTFILVYLPIKSDITSTYIGGGETILWSNYYWWFDYAVSIGLNPLHDSYQFFPMGVDIIEGGLLPMFLFIPVTHIYGSIASYNLWILVTFVLSGFGMYLLTDYLICDKRISFISGLIFAFFPFHFAAIMGGHLHTYSFCFLPFFVLFMHKMLEQPALQNVIIAAFFFSCNALTSWTIGIMATLFFVVYILIHYRKLMIRENLINIISFFVLSLLFISPGLFLILKNIYSGANISFTILDFCFFPADLLGYIIPSPLNPLFKVISPIYANFAGNGSENIVFIGYTVIFFSVFAILYHGRDQKMIPYVVTLIIALFISLSPIPRLNGMIIPLINGVGVLSFFIPFFNMIRVPSRYDILVMFCLAVVTAFGIKAFFNHFKMKIFTQTICIFVIATLIITEFAVIMPSTLSIKTPDFYNNISADNNSTLLDLPFQGSPVSLYEDQRYDEYQKVHHKKTLGGYTLKIYQHYVDTIIRPCPVLSYLYALDNEINKEKVDPFEYLYERTGLRIDAGNSFIEKIFFKDYYKANSSLPLHDNNITDPLEFLNDKYNIKYIVVHQAMMTEGDFIKTLEYLGDDYFRDDSVSGDPLIIYCL